MEEVVKRAVAPSHNVCIVIHVFIGAYVDTVLGFCLTVQNSNSGSPPLRFLRLLLLSFPSTSYLSRSLLNPFSPLSLSLVPSLASPLLPEADRTTMIEGSEKHNFQNKVSRLMDIIMSSPYTGKQGFLRKLIPIPQTYWSFHSVRDESFLAANKYLEIKVEHNAGAKTISIVYLVVGTLKADLINTLRTAARFGTTYSLEAMAPPFGPGSG